MFKFVAMVMGSVFQSEAEQELDLVSIVNNDIKSNTPILLCSVTGYDASCLLYTSDAADE